MVKMKTKNDFLNDCFFVIYMLIAIVALCEGLELLEIDKNSYEELQALRDSTETPKSIVELIRKSYDDEKITIKEYNHIKKRMWRINSFKPEGDEYQPQAPTRKKEETKVRYPLNQVEQSNAGPEAEPFLEWFPPQELQMIRKEAIENHCTGDLLYILLAIRKAENGSEGREFGIMHPRAVDTNLEIQAGWAAATVSKNYQRWLDAGSPDGFITFLGNKYCPIGVANDPDGLNQHWIGNVTKWTTIFANADRVK